jgi:catecholate siderophore receptor
MQPRSLHIAALFLFFGASQTIVAQSVPTLPPDTTTVDSSAPKLTPVRVTGRSVRHRGYAQPNPSSALKTNAPLIDIPQAITVVSRELIRDQGMQGMMDAVRYVPGITMGQGEGNRDQTTIRGNSTTADFFVDGVRDDAQYFRDLYNVDRIEALKGSNALMFGRGGGGGVLNRVMKEAEWVPVREVTLQAGSFDNRRGTADLGQSLSSLVAGRINGMYENSGLFRNAVRIKRQGINPTLTVLSPSQKTKATLGYESFLDHRTADRGIPSFAGRPFETGLSTFFGNPVLSYSDVKVHSAVGTLAHEASNGLGFRNQTRFTSYRKAYQNIFPGAVTADGLQVNLEGYNNAHDRRNFFNQSDVTYSAQLGSTVHTLLLGFEIGDQSTDNFRNTAYFNSTSTSLAVPTSSPTVFAPVTFRQSATDADNRVANTVRSIYTQDQVALSDYVQLIGGVRYERFGITYHNNRSDETLRRFDSMISPRFGIVLKPLATASIYGGYSVSFLPSAGDQFSSLTDVTKALDPERFQNVEMGAKWDFAERLSLTAALYRLDRTNTKAPAPDNPGVTVQTGSQRSTGYELGIAGSITPEWQIAGALARQNAVIASTTTSAPAGARVPLVPHATLSLWNRYQPIQKLGVGLGVIHQAKMFAALNNTVVLPSFNRVDAAVYFGLGLGMAAQANVENLLNARYYPLANGNNNITPGSPRAMRVTLTSSF